MSKRFPGTSRDFLNQLRVERCKRKRAFSTWDEAEAECVDIARNGQRGDDANPPTPYRCDQLGDAHYHIGHLRFRSNRNEETR